MATAWLALQVQLKPTTMVRYEVALRCQILPRFELVPLSRITHSDVSSWVQSLTDEGLAPATVRYAHRVLSLGLTAAVRDGRLVRNVAEGVPLPRVVAIPKRFLTHDQVQALADAVLALRHAHPGPGLRRHLVRTLSRPVRSVRQTFQAVGLILA